MRIKVVVKSNGISKSYILGVPAHIKLISDLKQHIASIIDLESADEDTFELTVQGAELLASEKVEDILREDDIVGVSFTFKPKKESGPSVSSGSRNQTQEDQELDHLFLANLEDIMMLRDHFKSVKRIKTSGNQSIPVKADYSKERKAVPRRKGFRPVSEDEETDPEQEIKTKPAKAIQTKKISPQSQPAKKIIASKKEQRSSSSSNSEDQNIKTSKPLAKKVAESAANQKAHTQLKKPNPANKIILNAPDPEQELREKQSQWMQLESVQNKHKKKEITKKPDPSNPHKNIIQKKPANLSYHADQQNSSFNAPKQEKQPFQKPNQNILQGPQVSFHSQKQTQNFSREESKATSLPKPAKPIQMSNTFNNVSSAQNGTAKEKTTSVQAKGLPQITPVQNKFNPEKFVEVPAAVLIDMQKKGKQALYKLGDTILYKCEELDLRTFSPIVSEYKIAKILEIKGDRLSLRVIVSGAAPKAPKEEGEDSGEEEEEDMNPTLQLHNFAEFHIDKASLNPQRAEAIKASLIEFMEELQNSSAKKTQEDISGSMVQGHQKGGNQPNTSETEQDHRLTVLKRIGRQMNYYFSDKNYQRDDFIKTEERKDPDRFIEIQVFMNFPRVQQLCSGASQLTEAILYLLETTPSAEIELNEDKTKIRKKLKTATKKAPNSESKASSAEVNQNSESAV